MAVTRLAPTLTLLCGLLPATIPHIHAADSAAPAAPTSFIEALKGGKAGMNIRLRYEGVENDGDGRDDATAVTARVMLQYKTGTYKNMYGFVGMQATEALVRDYAAFDATYSAVPDTEGADLYQLYAGYKTDKADVKLGRQAIAWNDMRHLGHVGWRQNWQSFDSATGNFKVGKKAEVTAYYLANRRNIFRAHTPLTGLLGEVKFNINKMHKASVYGYQWDFSRPANANGSLSTFGARYDGKFPVSDSAKLSLYGEYASQSEAGDSTLSYSAPYMRGVIGLNFSSIGLKLGYEVLGSDDSKKAFSVPFGTNHAFNGWSDVLLGGNGNDGLQDAYVEVSAKVPSAKGLILKAIYHSFTADNVAGGASDDVGSEINALVLYKVPSVKGLAVGLKYAAFSAGDYNGNARSDVNKTWLWMQYGF